MRTYQVAQAPNAEGWPFLYDGQAYLADGTPLTERDEDRRVVASKASVDFAKVTCSGGLRTLAERREGIAALARALDEDDRVRAPLLMLMLQIDPVPELSKYNPWHKPKGPGGGQFTSGSQLGSSGSTNIFFVGQTGVQHGAWNRQPTAARPALEPAAQQLNAQFSSTFDPTGKDPHAVIAYILVQRLIRNAILLVTRLDFTPGMPGYGNALDAAVAAEIKARNDPMLHSKPVYLGRNYLPGAWVIPPLGSSVPDIVYGHPEHPLAVFELKTGRAATNMDAETRAQKIRTLLNVPGDPLYEYFYVTGQ